MAVGDGRYIILITMTTITMVTITTTMWTMRRVTVAMDLGERRNVDCGIVCVVWLLYSVHVELVSSSGLIHCAKSIIRRRESIKLRYVPENTVGRVT